MPVTLSKIFTAILKAPVRFYRFWLSPWLGHGCRYNPTCSAYMLDALDTHGPIKGLTLGLRRISRCHPWSKRPYEDPVPKRVLRHKNDKDS